MPNDITLTDTTKPPTERPLRLLSKVQVLDRVGVTYTTIWTWMREGTFPRSIRLSDGKCPRIAWYEHEVEFWLANRHRQRLKGDPSEPEVIGGDERAAERDGPESNDGGEVTS